MIALGETCIGLIDTAHATFHVVPDSFLLVPQHRLGPLAEDAEGAEENPLLRVSCFIRQREPHHQIDRNRREQQRVDAPGHRERHAHDRAQDREDAVDAPGPGDEGKRVGAFQLFERRGEEDTQTHPDGRDDSDDDQQARPELQADEVRKDRENPSVGEQD